MLIILLISTTVGLVPLQEKFINKMETIVTSRKQVEMTVDEGFYTESEMKDDLGWSQFCPYNLL